MANFDQTSSVVHASIAYFVHTITCWIQLLVASTLQNYFCLKAATDI